MVSATRRTLVVIAASALVAACGWIIGLEDEHLRPPSDGGGGLDAASSDARGAEDAGDAAVPADAPFEARVPVLIAEGGVGAIAVDSTHVYWIVPHTMGKNGRIVRAPKDGGAQVEYAGIELPTEIAVDDTTVYVLENAYSPTGTWGALHALAKDLTDGGWVDTRPNAAYVGLAMSDQGVYFSTQEGATATIRMFAKNAARGTSCALVSETAHVASLGADRVGNVYYRFTQAAPSLSLTWRASSDCADAGPTRFDLNPVYNFSPLVTDDAAVYWSEEHHLWRKAKDAAVAASATTLDPDALAQPVALGLARWNVRLYFTVDGSGWVYSTVIGSQTTQPVAQAGQPYRIVVDDKGTIFFTDDFGAVWRVDP